MSSEDYTWRPARPGPPPLPPVPPRRRGSPWPLVLLMVGALALGAGAPGRRIGIDHW